MVITNLECYRIEFVFERCYVDSEYGVNFTDGFSEISCSVDGGPSISLDIEDLMLDTCEPASASGSDYSRVTENYHAVFEIMAEKFDLSKIKFYTYGRPTFLQYINIDSLTVCATENDDYYRMTVTVRGNDKIIKQIQAQLQKQVDVVQIADLDRDDCVFRELLLIKIRCAASQRSEIVDICTIFKAKPIDVSSDDTMIIELTGETSKIDALIDVLKPYGVLEMARSGGSALGRGGKTLRTNEND